MAKEFKRTAYSEKLRDPRWQKMRLKVMERDEFHCQICGDGESTLNVHHRVYRNGAEPWDYPLEHLVTLCEDCHEREREHWLEIEHDLLLALKRRFLAHEASWFVLIAEELAFAHIPDVVMSALHRYLSDHERVKAIVEWYFETIKAEQDQKSK